MKKYRKTIGEIPAETFVNDTLVSFDEEGIAIVDEVVAETLDAIPGYEFVAEEGENPTEDENALTDENDASDELVEENVEPVAIEVDADAETDEDAETGDDEEDEDTSEEEAPKTAIKRPTRTKRPTSKK